MSALLERLEALSLSQLRTTAKSDSAAGVLAEWELAKRLGLPTPERQCVVQDEDGSYIIAGPTAVQRVSADHVAVTDESVGKETFSPPQGARDAAQRALDWLAEGEAGSGFTDVGRARAAQLARGDSVSEDTIRRMASYFARHEVDSRATGWNNGEDGFPSPGRVAWDAWGGDAGRTWAESIVRRLNNADKTADKARYVKKEDARQFTLGPLYVPDFVDAHGEWTDATELQNAVWGWVRSGDRRIFDQHDTTKVAGEWVEVMTLPVPWTVMMKDADGNDVGEVTYPANTVFLGVIWNNESWADVKAGRKRGYSIGGFADRVMAEVPADATRSGVEMED